MLQPFLDSGLVDYRFWPYINRDFVTQHVDNWSQEAIISVCIALQEHTSTFLGIFDPDEWLAIPDPDHALPNSELHRAQPVKPSSAHVLLEPSSCVRFHKQPLAIEPDVEP